VAVLLVLAGAIGLSGCSLMQSSECVSWVTFEGDQQMLAESARLIVVGEVIEQSGTADLLGGDARLYRFDVHEASDERFVGLELEIASRSDGCAADPYGAGDQLDTDERIAVFLSTDEQWNGLATLTPFDGVVPADELEPGLVPGLPAVNPPS
jgi:hypothetical protein